MSEKNEWKLVPVEPTAEMWAAVNKLDNEMAAGSYDGKGASIEQVWNCLVDAAPAQHYQWLVTVAQMKVLAAELIRAAESMGGDDEESRDIELVLAVAPSATVLDDDGVGNEQPILTVRLEEYPEEGVYPVDPRDPTGGRIDAATPPAPSAPGDAQDERQAFEAWFTRNDETKDMAERAVRRCESSGAYVLMQTYTAWEIWRAARASVAAPAAGDALQFLADTDGAIESLTLGGNTRYRVWWPYLDERQAEWFASPLEAVDAALAAQQGKGGVA